MYCQTEISHFVHLSLEQKPLPNLEGIFYRNKKLQFFYSFISRKTSNALIVINLCQSWPSTEVASIPVCPVLYPSLLFLPSWHPSQRQRYFLMCVCPLVLYLVFVLSFLPPILFIYLYTLAPYTADRVLRSIEFSMYHFCDLVQIFSLRSFFRTCLLCFNLSVSVQNSDPYVTTGLISVL